MIRQALFCFGHAQRGSLCTTMYGFFSGALETITGSKAELEINGKPAWKADGLQGPKTGFICLQAEVPGGGQCLFRNVHITEV